MLADIDHGSWKTITVKALRCTQREWAEETENE